MQHKPKKTFTFQGNFQLRKPNPGHGVGFPTVYKFTRSRIGQVSKLGSNQATNENNQEGRLSRNISSKNVVYAPSIHNVKREKRYCNYPARQRFSLTFKPFFVWSKIGDGKRAIPADPRKKKKMRKNKKRALPTPSITPK